MEQTEVKAVEVKEPVQVQNTATIENQQVENPQERNWKAFREQRDLERKQKEAAEKMALQKAQEAEALRAAMDALLNKPTHQPQSSDEELSEDDKINRKVELALAAKEKQYEEQRRQREQQEFPQKLTQTFPDFERICTTENLDYLEYHYPEVASAFKFAPDGFDKWASVYKAVKRFVPNPESLKEQSKAEKNLSKPQSMAAPGVTSTGDTPPHQIDDRKRADNWKRMQRVMKGL